MLGKAWPSSGFVGMLTCTGTKMIQDSSLTNTETNNTTCDMFVVCVCLLVFV